MARSLYRNDFKSDSPKLAGCLVIAPDAGAALEDLRLFVAIAFGSVVSTQR